jgi:hypothetical protein
MTNIDAALLATVTGGDCHVTNGSDRRAVVTWAQQDPGAPYPESTAIRYVQPGDSTTVPRGRFEAAGMPGHDVAHCRTSEGYALSNTAGWNGGFGLKTQP